MSNARQVLTEGFGTPLVWLYNTGNEILLDGEGKFLNSYVTKFEYVYDEEEDDTCDITFEFESVSQMNLRYLAPHVILIVQWGYLAPGGRVIPSPKRKVAIRDITTSYERDKIQMEIKCTDLVAFMNNFRVNTQNKYADPDAETKIQAHKDSENWFIEWLKELIDGKFKATVTDKKKSFRMDSQGEIQNFEYDERTGRYQVARDNTAYEVKQLINFHAAKVINGAGQAIKQNIRSQLRALDAIEGLGGPYIADTTDDTIHIRQRNFHQMPFKNYTYGGGHGELITFKHITDTRKVKEDISVATSVDPENKTVKTTQVVTLPHDRVVCVWPNQDYTKEPIPVPTEKIDAEIEKYREIFEYNNKEPLNQIEPEPLKIFLPKEDSPTMEDMQRGDLPKSMPFEVITIPVKDVLSTPYAQERIGIRKKSSVEAFVNAQEIVGKKIEKIQRKYEATAEVIGDPSLIKGKTYGIYGVSELDKGIWYAKKVIHRITYKGGYISTMELLKKPATVSISQQEFTIKMREIEGRIKPENEEIFKTNEIYTPDLNDVDITTTDMDHAQEQTWENIQRQAIANMFDRLEILEEEEEFTLGKGGGNYPETFGVSNMGEEAHNT